MKNCLYEFLWVFCLLCGLVLVDKFGFYMMCFCMPLICSREQSSTTMIEGLPSIVNNLFFLPVSSWYLGVALTLPNILLSSSC